MKVRVFSFHRSVLFSSAILLFGFATCLLGSSSNARAAATYTLIHGFADAPTDGARPTYGSTLVASGTNLFGSTPTGGAKTNGVIFKVSTGGAGEKLLHSFNGHTELNPSGSINDGANPGGTPLLIGSTLYGTTASGGSNGFGLGTIYSISTTGTGFQLLHHFGGVNDGYTPQGSLIASGSTLFGMTSQGGTNFSEGVVFSIGTDGSNYQILQNFPPGTGTPYGALVLSGSTLYGITRSEIFSISTNGSGFTVLHSFIGTTNDGATPFGSLIVSGSTLYGMTSQGGVNDLGCAFAIDTGGGNFHLIHSFGMSEGWLPYGDLTLSGTTLYGMTSVGGANGLGEGTVFQMGTDGSGYQIIHTFSNVSPDGSTPYGSLLFLNSKLYGMTIAGGAPKNAGAVFSLSGGSIGATTGAVKVTLTPSGALTAGAEWQIDGGAFHASGAVVTGLSPGSHLVAFKAVTGWAPPASGLATSTVGITNAYQVAYTQLPTLTITQPTGVPTLTIPDLTMAGTAHSSVGVSNVLASLNGGAWLPVFTANKFTNWSDEFGAVVPGTNTVQVYAIDTAGNHSATNTIKAVYVLSAPLSVSVSGGKCTITPNYSNASLVIGRAYSMTVSNVPGFKFIGWGGSTNSTNPILHFTMESNLDFIANVLDISKPTNTIVKPTANLNVSNANYTVVGTAKDNVGVVSVSCSVDGGATWTPAISTNNFTNWTADVTLNPGTNIVLAYSSDAAGNNSVTNKVSMFYVLTAPFSVEIFGKGTITPNYDGKSLVIGRAYSMAATNAPGFKFSTWVGSSSSTNHILHFIMASNMAYRAVFVDIIKPTISITSPTAGLRVSNANFLVMGKAADNYLLSSVSVQINGGGYNPAGLLSASNWMAPVLLSPGTNIVQAYATDLYGNQSSNATVKFTYFIPPDWAPDSLSGLRAKVTSISDDVSSVVYGADTFSRLTTNINSYPSVGEYTYSKLDTNAAQLTMVFELPPIMPSSTNTLALMFDALNSGTYSNLDNGDTGTFSLSSASNLAVASLAGKTITATNIAQLNGAVLTMGTTNFSQKESPGGSVYAGNYTYQKVSPAAGMLITTYTSPANKAGEVTYVQLTFLTAASGNYFLSSFDDLGNFKNSTQGTFKIP